MSRFYPLCCHSRESNVGRRSGARSSPRWRRACRAPTLLPSKAVPWWVLAQQPRMRLVRASRPVPSQRRSGRVPAVDIGMEHGPLACSRGCRFTFAVLAAAVRSGAQHPGRRQDRQLAAVCESCANGRHLGAQEPPRDHREWVSDDSFARGINPFQDGAKPPSCVCHLGYAEVSEIGPKTPQNSMVFSGSLPNIPRETVPVASSQT